MGSVLALLLHAGCQPREPILPNGFLPDPVEAPPEAPPPSYAVVAAGYNERAEALDRLWASTNVQLRWRDADGDAEFEEGDGKLLFVRSSPVSSRVALTVEKLGRTLLWTGSDEERFWLFNLDEDVAYVGELRNVGRACMRDLPTPVHPSLVPYVLGLMPLPPAGEAGAGSVEWLRGHLLVEPPGMRLRLLLEPDTLRPIRVDLTDAAGVSAVIAQLDAYEPVPVGGLPTEAWPAAPTRADLFVVGEEARMTLVLSRLSDGAERIREAAFDFDTLVGAHRPDEVVVLDRDCP